MLTNKIHNPRFLQQVELAKKLITEISVLELKTKLASKINFTLIDVREDSEWPIDALPTAIHVGKGVLERDIEKIIPDINHNIVVYCSGGYRSVLAAAALQSMGYCNVESLNGGARAWSAE